MFETIFDLLHDRSNACNWHALIECLVALAMVAAGLAAIVLCGGCWPLVLLGLVVALAGVVGLIVGHL